MLMCTCMLVRDAYTRVHVYIQMAWPRLLEKLEGDGPFGLCLDALAPELEFGVDGAMEDEVVVQPLRMEGADGRVMADLLGDESETKVISKD